MNFEFHHIGVAAESLGVGLDFFEPLGYVLVKSVCDPGLGVQCDFLEHRSAPRIELVTDIPGSGVVAPWLRQVSLRPYHFAFFTGAVDNLPGRLFSDWKTAKAFPSKQVCFSMQRQLLVEYIADAQT